MPETKQEMRNTGLDGVGTSAAEFTDLVRKHTELWASVARQAGIEPQ